MRQKDAIGWSHLENGVLPCVVDRLISSIFDIEFKFGLLLYWKIANVIALRKRDGELRLLPSLHVASCKHFI